MLTAMDVDKIVSRNFAPDIKKLAHEIGANLYDPDALRVICSRIAASYGKDELWTAIELAETIYGGDKPLWRLIPCEITKRKKTTKAEAIAQHINALVKLLQDEPDTVVGPILDHLLERINWKRLERVVEKVT